MRPKGLPKENDLTGILSISVSDSRALSITDFIVRSKLEQRLNVACKIKAERELSDKKGSRANLPILLKEAKEDFGRLGRAYVSHLFHSAQSSLQLTSDIVKGYCERSVDLDIMFRCLLSHALYCYKQLFRSFQLRGYFQPDEESIYIEEYLSFLDELRKELPDLDQPRVYIIDAVTYISKHEALRTRPHLARIFRLSCLCLDEDYTNMPTVKFGSVRTDDPKSKLIDIILPVQSFFINVGHSIDILTTASSISEFLAFESTFGGSAFSDTYDPWEGLNYFDRSSILSPLKPKRDTQKSDTRRLRFKDLKSRKVTKSLLSSSVENSPVKRPSESELP